jgi:hypothetical protein
MRWVSRRHVGPPLAACLVAARRKRRPYCFPAIEGTPSTLTCAVRRGVLDSGVPLAAIAFAEGDLQRLRQRERLFAREVDRDGVPL